MSQNGIFTNWSRKHSALYSHQPMRVGHILHQSDLFTNEALAELIEGVPRDHYHVNSMGPRGHDRSSWREGEIKGLSGQEVLSAVCNGQIWVSLQRLEEINDDYARLLEQIYDETEDRVEGLRTYKRSLGLLISSPKAQVFLPLRYSRPVPVADPRPQAGLSSIPTPRRS